MLVIKERLTVKKVMQAVDLVTLNVKPSIKRYNVLLIDDDEISNRVLRHYLVALSSNSDSVESGEEALGLFEIHKYDLIIMDLQMPTMDGPKVLSTLKEQFSVVPPTILLTSQEVEEVELIKKGFKAVYWKPLSFKMASSMLEHCKDIQILD